MAVVRAPTEAELLTASEAAGLIRIHPNILRGYADQGLIEHFRLPGGHPRFPRKGVEAFVARSHDRTISEPSEDQMANPLRESGECGLSSNSLRPST